MKLIIADMAAEMYPEQVDARRMADMLVNN